MSQFLKRYKPSKTKLHQAQAIYWLCYFFAVVFLALFGVKTYSSACIASIGAAQYVGWFHFAIIIMIELALAWQAMAGVMINAMTITILHVLSRISMVLAGSKYFYSAGCVVYVMFAMLLVYHNQFAMADFKAEANSKKKII